MSQSSGRSRANVVQEDIQNAKQRSLQLARRELRHTKNELQDIRRSFTESRDAFLRQIADLENLNRAKEREYAIRLKNAEKNLVKDLLPVVDSLEAGSRDNDHGGILKPFRDMLLNILRSHGLKKVETVGSKFDPFRHEVVGVTDEGEDGKIHDEVQEGYGINDEVIRPAKVIVTKR